MLEGASSLTLWLAGDARASHELQLDGEPIAPRARRVLAGGVQYQLDLAAGYKHLRVRSDAGEHSLALGSDSTAPALKEAQALRRSGRLAEALAVLDGLLASGSAAEQNRARALGARIQLARGDALLAARELGETFREAQALGRVSDALRDAFALCFIQLTQLNDLIGARATLEQVRPLLADDPAGRGFHAHYSGMLAAALADPSGAERSFRDAARLAEQLGEAGQARDALVQLAHILGSRGQFAEAIASVQQLLESDVTLGDCERGPLHANLGWLGMQALPRHGELLDIRQQLERAAQLDAACGQPFYQRYDALNLGLWALEQGRVADADRQLVLLRQLRGGESSELAQWQAELEAQLELRRGNAAAALQHFTREVSLAESRADADGVFRGQVGRGRAQLLLQRTAEAQAAFEAAERALRSLDLALRLGVERDGGVGQRDQAWRQLVQARVELGQLEAALQIALQAFTFSLGPLHGVRPLRPLPPPVQQRRDEHLARFRSLRAELESSSSADWQLSLEELEARRSERVRLAWEAENELIAAVQLLDAARPADPARKAQRLLPEAGELLMVVFPAQAGWFQFLRWNELTTVHHVPRWPGPEAAGETSALLQPAAALLRRAQRLSLLAYGAARDVRWAELRLDGEPLVARLPVLHRLGLAQRAPGVLALPRVVGVVGDPTSDLPGAQGEAKAVAAHWNTAAVELLLGPDAGRDGVLRALERSDLLHYAGHGMASDSSGLAGLRLAAGESLTPSDVLALERVPDTLLLASCDSARAGAPASAAGWSLAHAFIVAGSRQVLAPSRAIDDGAAEALLRDVHARLAAAGMDLALALQRAQRQAIETGRQGWEAFLVMAP